MDFAAGNRGRLPGSTNKRTREKIAKLKVDPFDYLSGLLAAADTEKALKVQCASMLLPYTSARLKEQAPRRIANPLAISPPQSASECTTIIAMVLTAAAAGKLDLNDAQELVKMAESYVRSFAASDLEAIVARVRDEVRSELLSVGLERHAEYCVPEASVAQ
jgi:hypothetical protein